MSQAVLERPPVAHHRNPLHAAAPQLRATPRSPARNAPPLAAAFVKGACVYALVAGLMTAIHWPVLEVCDSATRIGVALQIGMTASCVAGWLSLILVFDRFIGEAE